MHKKSLLSCRHKQTALFDEGDFLYMGHKMNEIWKAIKGFDNYLVSNCGQIYSKKRQGTNGGILNGGNNGDGYLYVCLYKNKKRNNRLIHRLVALSFMGECPHRKEINHLDGNKYNNALSNLEYVTRLENVHHAIKSGLTNVKGENHPQAKLSLNEVNEIRVKLNNGLKRKNIAKEYNVSYAAITDIALNRSWIE